MQTLITSKQEFKVCLLGVNKFSKINKVGVHQVVESIRDVEDAFDTANKDLFPVVYLYVSDLKLVKEIKEMFFAI